MLPLLFVSLLIVAAIAGLAVLYRSDRHGGARRFTLPEFVQGSWWLICFVLAAPVVYVFEQELYEAFAVLLGLVDRLVTEHFPRVVGTVAGVVASGSRASSLPYVLFAFGLTAVLTAVLLALSIAGSRAVIRMIAALAIPCGVIYWLATYPGDGGPPRHLLDLILVGYTGALFYGVVFPMLWRGFEPLLAHTIGAAAFQRLRAQIYGAGPRYAQPLYLVLGILALVGGIAHVVAPIAQETGTVAIGRWGANRPGFHAPTSDPSQLRGGQFIIRQGDEIATGIVLAPQEALLFESTGEAIVQFAPGQRVPLRRTAAPGNDAELCPLPLGEPQASARCSQYMVGSPHGGEVVLIGPTRRGGSAVTVTISRPPLGTGEYRWLAAGEVLPMRVDSQPYYCAGPGLSGARRGDKEKRSALKSVLSCTPGSHMVWPELPRGDVEIRAGEQMTWFGGFSSDQHFSSR